MKGGAELAHYKELALEREREPGWQSYSADLVEIDEELQDWYTPRLMAPVRYGTCSRP
jgi:hypothetical protein